MRLELVSRGYRRRIVELAAAISDDFASFDGPLEAGAAHHAALNYQRPGFTGAVTPAQRQPWPNHH
jgi:hypothetical protein